MVAESVVLVAVAVEDEIVVLVCVSVVVEMVNVLVTVVDVVVVLVSVVVDDDVLVVAHDVSMVVTSASIIAFMTDATAKHSSRSAANPCPTHCIDVNVALGASETSKLLL